VVISISFMHVRCLVIGSCKSIVFLELAFLISFMHVKGLMKDPSSLFFLNLLF
jgi:hypothetical protein